MIAVMVGPSRLPALAVHDASSVCVASGVGYSSSRTGSVAWRLVILLPVMEPLLAARRVLALGMEALSRQLLRLTVADWILRLTWKHCQRHGRTATGLPRRWWSGDAVSSAA